MKPNNRSFGSGVAPSKYSASQVEQNKEAYRQDGRVSYPVILRNTDTWSAHDSRQVAGPNMLRLISVEACESPPRLETRHNSYH